MYMRIFSAPARPGTVDELAHRLQAFITGQLHGLPGFLQLYGGGDRSTNQVTLVSVWETQAAMAGASRHVQAFAAEVQDLLAGAPMVTTYEILAQG
jgi:quinol monooxygenase YgiN